MESHGFDYRWEAVKEDGPKIYKESEIRKQKYRNGEFQRHEVLHFLRGNLEADHREKAASNADKCTFCVTTTNLTLTDKEYHTNGPSHRRNSIDRVQQFCNTSIPVYLLASPKKEGKGVIVGPLRMVLSNFIYRKWFEPYKTEIEFDRSLIEFIRPIDMKCTETRPPASTFDTLTSLNKDICTHVEETKDNAIRMICKRLETSSDAGLTGIQEEDEKKEKLKRRHREEMSDLAESLRHCYCIQHLFRAIFLVVYAKNYMGEGSSDIGKMPVFIALTGKQQGLSAPITFDSICDKIDAVINRGPHMVVQTTLETAASFLVDLERREIAAVGLRPNPPAEIRSRVLRHLDWQDRECSRWFEELGSSSNWVDTTIYTEWTGRGKDQDVYYAERREEFQRKIWAPYVGLWNT